MTTDSKHNKNAPVFVNRRKGTDRRLEHDRCQDMPMDLFHRKRRKTVDRRAGDRSLLEDYLAFSETTIGTTIMSKTTASDKKPN